MNEILFVTVLGVLFFGMIFWGAKKLPKEHWQVVGSVPIRKNDDGSWVTYTFTYYGVLCATAYLLASALFVVLVGSIGVHFSYAFGMMVPLLIVCMPLSRFVAKVVEGKANTFTVGGAVFCGIIVAPWMISELAAMFEFVSGDPIPSMATFAALAIAYCFGEGIGRLACLSFGCCYGKHMSDLPRFIRKIFRRNTTRFYGNCKKAVYEGKAEGKHLFPVQVVTSVLYVSTGLIAVVLFLAGMFTAAMVFVVAVTQLWRFFSEFFRADFRGTGRWSAYQYMALIAVNYAIIVYPFFGGDDAVNVVFSDGLNSLLSVPALIAVQGIWLVSFIYMGKSTVLKSSTSYSIIEDSI